MLSEARKDVARPYMALLGLVIISVFIPKSVGSHQRILIVAKGGGRTSHCHLQKLLEMICKTHFCSEILGFYEKSNAK